MGIPAWSSDRESWLCHSSREGLTRCLDKWLALVSDSSANVASVTSIVHTAIMPSQYTTPPYISLMWEDM